MPEPSSLANSSLVKRVSVGPAAPAVPARNTSTAHNQVAVNARTRVSVCRSLAGAFTHGVASLARREAALLQQRAPAAQQARTRKAGQRQQRRHIETAAAAT